MAHLIVLWGGEKSWRKSVAIMLSELANAELISMHSILVLMGIEPKNEKSLAKGIVIEVIDEMIPRAIRLLESGKDVIIDGIFRDEGEINYLNSKIHFESYLFFLGKPESPECRISTCIDEMGRPEDAASEIYDLLK